MKILIIGFLFIMRNAKEKIYYTTCSGIVENCGSCCKKGARSCRKGYAIIEKTENANGGFRTMIFKCN
jgi:hypothetical protein